MSSWDYFDIMIPTSTRPGPSANVQLSSTYALCSTFGFVITSEDVVAIELVRPTLLLKKSMADGRFKPASLVRRFSKPRENGLIGLK